MKKALMAFLSTIMLLSSCGKDGAVGPQGPQGNANVTTTTFTVNTSDWTTTNVMSAAFAVPAITQAVFDRGIVQVYYSPWASEWYSMPFTTFVNGLAQSWQSSITVGAARVDVSNIDRTLPIKPSTPVKFRVVVASPSFRISHPNINWNNYAEVEDLLKQNQ